MMKLSEIADFLPHEMPADRLQEAMDRCYNDLGGDFLIFNRESYSPYDYGTQYLEFLYRPVKRTWAASCVCTACGDRFHLGWTSQSIPHDYCKNGVQRGVTMLVGPDETPYPGVPDFVGEDIVTYHDGADLICPSCGKSVTLKHKSAFRSMFDNQGIRYRVIFGYASVIQNRAALLFWMLERVFESDGNVTLTAKPERAVLIDFDGSLRSFRYDFRNGPNRKGNWIPSPIRDPSQKHYASHGAFPSKRGAVISARLPLSAPDFVATSGEKTGLSAYLAGGGQFPILYLRFWKQYPAIESIVKCGWIHFIDESIVADCFSLSSNYSSRQCQFSITLENLACWSKRKPCDILMMSRSEIRLFSNDNQWDCQTLRLWINFRTLGLFRPDDACEYCRVLALYGPANLADWLAVLRASGSLTTFDKLERYLRRQCGDAIPLSNGLRLLIDYRNMLSNLDKLLGDDAPKSDLFPAKLHETHNRVAKQLAETKKEFCNVPYLQLRETWSALEWSDGEICAKLPLSEMDLVREGRTLHHCVGSYGNSHLAGRFVIFIRHARRPERSWYTLNINTTGPEPTEIQLHGYRNDVVNGRSIPIPKRVRDFCNKWESEILLPVFRKVRASEKRMAAEQ